MSQWELLVTEGHVRAERWRNAVPVLFAAAVAAVVIGTGITFVLPRAEPSAAVAEAQSTYATAQREAVRRFLQNGGSIERQPTSAGPALTRELVPANIAAILAILNQSGHPPGNVIVQSPREFWARDWQSGRIYGVQKGRNLLVGYLVDTSFHYAGSRPEWQRSFGLFRRGQGNVWAFHCLAVQGAQPCETAPVEPSMIPATMRELLPSEAFARERQS